jgi:hypothetical protein
MKVNVTTNTCSAWQETMQRRSLFAVSGENHRTIPLAVLSTLIVFQTSSRDAKGTYVKNIPPRWLEQFTNLMRLISI